MKKSCSVLVDKEFEELCLDALKQDGYRITRPRKAVIACLASAKRPLTAPELFERLSRSESPVSVDKVSVYRILDTFLDLGLVHRVMPSGAYLACSHQSCIDSYHVLSRCKDCNKVKELDIPPEIVAPLLAHLQKQLQFVPDSHLLHMEGHCASCAV